MTVVSNRALSDSVAPICEIFPSSTSILWKLAVGIPVVIAFILAIFIAYHARLAWIRQELKMRREKDLEEIMERMVDHYDDEYEVVDESPLPYYMRKKNGGHYAPLQQL
ncbi:hypothetical protein GCK72_023076 [Caenorhabditis remanei]|uniref:Uncharacterized protein n=1 Tax=Caenorhabditis remanei TaxID=31234 RepID=E3MKM9_CAERE|nr:hypothetical protein GCK72_023076 [Caenorhabditis remanei]EFP04098.1 hypothetical protein CRE_27637 [Caenorhabditis remanei]KAF1746619.1 hypothetical protein GCK72_023076 [Caenorhabditis remanei]